MLFDKTEPHRRATGSRTRRTVSISVESLEGRALLSGITYPTGPTPTSPPPVTIPPSTPPVPVTMDPAPTPPVATLPSTPKAPVSTPQTPDPAKAPKSMKATHEANKDAKTTGIVTKSPHFYQFYTGPKLAQLDAVKASGDLSRDGSAFTFTGTTEGRINNASDVYVWGIDRNGNLSSGPFTDVPNVKFDALVVVRLNSSLTPTASVIDLVSGNTTVLAPGSASIHGKTVSVTVSSQLLPSTGLAPSQYRFNFWPEIAGGSGSSAVASFAPASTTVQVGIAR